MKELKIVPPEGYCVDEENSTFECIKFKPKELTYDDIAKKLFAETGKEAYTIMDDGHIMYAGQLPTSFSDPNNAPTRKQCERLLAINKLMNVAYYFNEIVDKDITLTTKYIPEILTITGGLIINYYMPERKNGIVYFKTIKSAERAIKILGEETVKLAISL